MFVDGCCLGVLGTIVTFLFYFFKNLGVFGDGGVVMTNDVVLDECVRTLRFHGSCDKKLFELIGHNLCFDEL